MSGITVLAVAGPPASTVSPRFRIAAVTGTPIAMDLRNYADARGHCSTERPGTQTTAAETVPDGVLRTTAGTVTAPDHRFTGTAVARRSAA